MFCEYGTKLFFEQQLVSDGRSKLKKKKKEFFPSFLKSTIKLTKKKKEETGTN